MGYFPSDYSVGNNFRAVGFSVARSAAPILTVAFFRFRAISPVRAGEICFRRFPLFSRAVSLPPSLFSPLLRFLKEASVQNDFLEILMARGVTRDAPEHVPDVAACTPS